MSAASFRTTNWSPVSQVDPTTAYPMRVVARRTGLSADVIRAWEKRYQAITPLRTEGNARRYPQDQIERLELLRDVVSIGHSIGDIARLPAEALRALLAEEREQSNEPTPKDTVDEYLVAVQRWDLRTAQDHLTRAASLQPADTLILNMLSPAMAEIGERWRQGGLSISQEHAASAQVRGLLSTLLQTIHVDRGAPKLVVGAPEGHEHEIGALMASVLAAQVGVNPVYLGANVPLQDMEASLRETRARAVLFAVSRDLEADELIPLSEAIQYLAEGGTVWIGCPPGHALSALKATAGVSVFHSLSELQTAASHLARSG